MEKRNIIKDKTFDFSIKIIRLHIELKDKKEFVISNQLLRSATCIGANVQEADAAQTKKDFIAKMSITSKEARETRYWLPLLDKSQIVKHDYSKEITDIEEIIRISLVKTSQNPK
jgi:four helix bundle protein